MDLALEIGQPVAVLSRTMPEREFQRWMHYRNKKMLPSRRIEMYLAQIALLIARTMGNASEAKMSDFLFDVAKPRTTMKVTKGAAFLGVRKLGQGRKHGAR